MSKLRIVAENFSDEGTVEATPSFITSITNLQKQPRALVSRTGLVAPEWDVAPYNQEIKVALPGLKKVSAIVLGRHNFSVGTVVRYTLYDNAIYTDPPIYDSQDIVITTEDAATQIEAWGLFAWNTVGWAANSLDIPLRPELNHVHWIEADKVVGNELLHANTVDFLVETTTGESLLESGGVDTVDAFTGINSVIAIKIQLNILDTTQLEIGRLIVGDFLEPKYNMSYKHTLEWAEDSKQFRTEGHTLRSDISLPVRKMKFSLDTIDAADRSALTEGLRFVGLRNDFYISLFPRDNSVEKVQDYSGIMKITKEPIMSEYAPNIYKSKYVVEEV